MTSLTEQMYRLKVGKLPRMDISSLNKSRNNVNRSCDFSSNYINRRSLPKEIQKFQRNHKNFILGATIKDAPQVWISGQNTPLNKFSCVKPMLTGNILIYSARQVEEHGNIKNFPTFILGETRDFP
jgi:hypothetical protein